MAGTKARRRAGKALAAAGAALLAAVGVALAVCVPMAGRASAPPQDPDGAAAAGGAGPVDWGYWLSVNPDVVGSIEVPGTAISQPVVRAPGGDPTYYLSHDVYRERNLWGCPYVDAGCKAGLSSRNAVIFGHNISYPPAMFHELEGYRFAQFAAEHAEVVLHTPSCTRRLAVAGADTVPGWERAKRVEFAGAEDFRAYRDERLAACDVRVGELRNPGRMVTLCTCSYFDNPANERTLVYAG